MRTEQDVAPTTGSTSHPPARPRRLLATRRAQLALVLVTALLGGAVMAGAMAVGDPREQDPVAKPAPVEASEPRPSEAPETGQLSNGCVLNRRGVPSCGGLVGAAFGSNTDPAGWERRLGRPLGIHRTYYAPDKVPQAIAAAEDDVRDGRMPWISFKLPYSWREMAAGRGDAWATDVAERLARVDGPVWLAFHHEPENDGPMADWTQMQQRLSPLVRRIAPNVAYTIILTGWNQMYGPPWLSLDAVWPRDTVVDLVGFDVYNDYGVVRNGKRDLSVTQLADEYFVHFQEFSERYGVPWGVAETGITDAYGRRNPRWIRDTYRELLEHDGVALTYFNSRLNSTASWRLSGAKEQDFADALAKSPTVQLSGQPTGRPDRGATPAR